MMHGALSGTLIETELSKLVFYIYILALSFRSAFGMDYEISSYTDLDSHKAERDVNHWMIIMNKPGDTVMPVTQ